MARRKQLDPREAALVGHWAHASPKEVLSGLTLEEARFCPPGGKFSIYQEICHLVLCQEDILEAMARPTSGLSLDDEGLWPGEGGPGSRQELEATIQRLLEGLERAKKWLKKAEQPMACPRWEGVPVARGLQVLGSHTSYHLGRIALLRAMYRRSKG
ncbi:MAG TPA: DinB family protein [Candidatus Nitrosotenuis sp.]|nr:DinB family protein [Candidatus Nitrosotenuis sp.]